jgi:epoxyqueuosine reductase QueG
MDKNKNYTNLKKFCLAQGIDLFGVADTSVIKKDFMLNQKALVGLDYAVCLGVRLSGGVLSEIEGAPTRLYFYHYKTANMFLDQLAFKAGNYIQNKGFKAVSIPASQIVDWQNQKAHLSHKHVASLAGLGWIGRNNLLVNKKFGSQLRLATILTSMPLKVGHPLAQGCGECRSCITVCPAGAIKEDAHDFNHIQCFEKLKEFQKQRLVDQYICGVCVNACKGR